LQAQYALDCVSLLRRQNVASKAAELLYEHLTVVSTSSNTLHLHIVGGGLFALR
jgi:hypothetical protein